MCEAPGQEEYAELRGRWAKLPSHREPKRDGREAWLKRWTEPEMSLPGP